MKLSLDIKLPKRAQQAKERQELVVRARALMSEQLGSQDFSLPHAAALLFASERQLQRAFAEAGSAGFRYELTLMRVHRAAMLLQENPKLSVQRVCRAVGYSQAPHFTKAFKLHMKMTPKEWRERCRKT
jgi:two-component system, response regulator YesN